jgi:hypothetical protein
MRYLSALLVLIILPNVISAQNPGKINMSMQVGINTSFFGNRIGPYGYGEASSYSNFVRFSPKIGLGVAYDINKFLSIQSELNYSAQGGSYRQENDDIFYMGGDGSEQAYFYKNYRVNYVEIPLLLTINVSNLFNKEFPEDKLSVSVSSGAAISFNTASTLRYNGFEESGSSSGPLVDVDEKYDVIEVGYGKNNLSYIFNLGLNFLLRNRIPAFVNFRYQQTLFDVYSVEQLDSYNMKTKMGTACLSFGVMFKKK